MIRSKFFVGLLALAMASSLAAVEAEAQRKDKRAPAFTPQWAAPQLEVYPEGGLPGTRVVITGAQFHERTRVFYGDVPMPILARDKKEIVAVIPREASGDRFIYVVDETGRARTAYPFSLGYGRADRFDRFDRDRRFDRYDRDRRFDRYDRDRRFDRYDRDRRYDRFDRDRRFDRWVPPWHENPRGQSLQLQPRRGEPGTPILIHGRRFSPNATPYFGNQPMRILRRGPDFILAEVPPYARTGQFIYVVDRRRQIRSAQPFSLTEWSRRW